MGLPNDMQATEESYEDEVGTSVLQDELDGGGERFDAGTDDESGRKDFGYRMKARRRLEQMREERELAHLLRTEFDQ
jgi:hypothetical protein